MNNAPYLAQPIVWRPSESVIAQSNLTQFMAQHAIATLDQLNQWAIDEPAQFWEAVVQTLQWPFEQSYHTIRDVNDGIAWPKWFVGATTNAVWAALDRHAMGPRAQHLAVRAEQEDGTVRTLTYSQLAEHVSHVARGLRRLGVRMGDRVGVHLPMVPETVISLLALAKIGAVALPLFSGYGIEALQVRLNDAQAKVLITASSFERKGHVVSVADVVTQVVPKVPTLGHVVIVADPLESVPASWINWHTMANAAETIEEVDTVKVSPDTPLMILYTSGTTGKPKGTLHTHMGFPLKAAQDLWMYFDLKADDRLLWYTDIGWMMGPWMIWGGLINGATLVLYDGAIDYPDPSRLWQLIEDQGVSIFGIAPTAIRILMRMETHVAQYNMASLRILGSSGEPWNLEPWQWFFTQVGHSRCPIINYSGGTETSGGILSTNPISPQKPCAFNGPIAGMAAEVWDEGGHAVQGKVGELVIRAPWPGMTQGFWGSRERYLETYWATFPDVWVHGDWCYVDGEGYWYIMGRSDDTIKMAGKRVGPAEIESLAVSHSAVREAAAVGIPDSLKGEAIVLVVTLNTGCEERHEEILRALREKIPQAMGKAIAPKLIYIVPALPKTRNGKVVRRVIRAALLGEPLGDVSSVEDVSSIQAIPLIAGEGIS